MTERTEAAAPHSAPCTIVGGTGEYPAVPYGGMTWTCVRVPARMWVRDAACVCASARVCLPVCVCVCMRVCLCVCILCVCPRARMCMRALYVHARTRVC